jgi:uncharacterized SAM-binding protein YcdF (DUF218 family)
MQNRKRRPWIGGTPAIAAIRAGVLSQSDTRTVVRRRITSSGNRSQKLCGIVTLKERWGLSWQGRLFVTSVVLLAIYAVVLNVHPFLAVTHRVNAKILVVEGWIDEYALRAGADEFKTGDYEHIITTGGPVTGSGGYTNDYNTLASVGARRLKAAGVVDEFVQMVPSHVTGRERTYSSAVALRDWFHEHHIKVQNMNIVTETTHARRTWLLYQKAFGETATIGIIAVPNPDYDARHWWRYSEGVKGVGSEALAYVYARLFFHPSEPPRVENAAVASQGDTRQ